MDASTASGPHPLKGALTLEAWSGPRHIARRKALARGALYLPGRLANDVPKSHRSAVSPDPSRAEPEAPPPSDEPLIPLPVLVNRSRDTPEPSPLPDQPPPEPRRVPRGVVVFDLDGTILDDLNHISEVAADVMATAFGTPVDEARIHYLATTGLPFEAQLAQLYPDVPPLERHGVARLFHQRKAKEAYGTAHPFPEVPRVIKRLSLEQWTLVVSTGAEREIADLLLEREGIRYWFEAVLGAGQGTKREHLAEYRRRYPEVPVFLVGDSRFDMEAASSVPGVTALGRASSLPGWALAPKDLQKWGAVWADHSLTDLPQALARLERPPAGRARRAAPRKR
ncbi:MAG: HAD hydrolase-like protein [Thermoplasmata archaeon]|nr:HAD hydrolase-like protein [Thermoplasmata archaeon]